MDLSNLKFNWYQHNERTWRADLGNYRLEVIHSAGNGLWSWKVNNAGRLDFPSKEVAVEQAEHNARMRLIVDLAVGDRAREALAQGGITV